MNPADVMANMLPGISDLDLARYVLDQLTKEYGAPPVKVGDTVYTYDAVVGVWRASADAALLRCHIHALDGKYYAKSKNGIQEIHVLKLSSRQCSGVQKELEYMITNSRFFDDLPVGIAFTNGFLNAEFQLVKHSPDHKCTGNLAYAYLPDATAPRFMQFLNSVFENDSDKDARISVLMEFYGACLMGEAPKYQKAIYLYGKGADGKSTLQEIALAVFGPELTSAVMPEKWTERFGLAGLQNKRLNSVSEMPSNEMVRSDRFKAVITAEPITLEKKYKDGTQVRLIAGQIFAANKIPIVNDTSEGYWRRLIIFKFNNSFRGREIVGLADSIIADEKQGILNLMVQGARRLRDQKRYTHVPSSDLEITNARLYNNSVAQFILACFDRIDFATAKPKEGVQSAVLYKHYRSWACENGILAQYQVSAHVFAERLEALGIEHEKSSLHYYPLKFKELNNE